MFPKTEHAGGIQVNMLSGAVPKVLFEEATNAESHGIAENTGWCPVAKKKYCEAKHQATAGDQESTRTTKN